MTEPGPEHLETRAATDADPDAVAAFQRRELLTALRGLNAYVRAVFAGDIAA